MPHSCHLTATKGSDDSGLAVPMVRGRVVGLWDLLHKELVACHQDFLTKHLWMV